MTNSLHSLASGSTGNCTLLRANGASILVDVGLTLKRLEHALATANSCVEDLDAVVVTHEHADHVKGLARLRARCPDLPVYATAGTAGASGLPDKAYRRLLAGTRTAIGPCDLLPFATLHDAAEPIGLRVETGDTAFGIATDLGYWTRPVADALRDCQWLLLEFNHDSRMLRTGPYPQFLKRRVSGNKGHLSNDQARMLLDEVAHPRLQGVVLAHLSDTNNDASLAEREARRVVGTELVVRVARASGCEALREPQGIAHGEQLSLF